MRVSSSSSSGLLAATTTASKSFLDKPVDKSRNGYAPRVIIRLMRVADGADRISMPHSETVFQLVRAQNEAHIDRRLHCVGKAREGARHHELVVAAAFD